MFNWRAVLAGTAVMIVAGLLMQLLLAVTPMLFGWFSGHSMLNADYTDVLFLGVGLLGFLVTLISGGYVTAYVAQKPGYLNAGIAGGGVAGLSLLLSRSGGELTIFSVVFLAAGVMLALFGAFLWGRKQSCTTGEVAPKS